MRRFLSIRSAAFAVTLSVAGLLPTDAEVVDVSGPHFLGFAGDFEEHGFDVNSRGTVVGTARFLDGFGRTPNLAVRSIGGGAPVRLGQPDGSGWVSIGALAVSETDEAAGLGQRLRPDWGLNLVEMRALKWNAAGEGTVLPHLVDPTGPPPPQEDGVFNHSGARGISPNGRFVAGHSHDGNGMLRATVWDGNTPTALACLNPSDCEDVAYVVNDAGEAAGTSSNGSRFFGVRWRADGSAQVLADPVSPFFPATTSTVVNIRAITSSGDVYGTVHQGNATSFRYTLVRWAPDGTPTEIGPNALERNGSLLFVNDATDAGLFLYDDCESFRCVPMLGLNGKFTFTVATLPTTVSYRALSQVTGHPPRAYLTGSERIPAESRSGIHRAVVTLSATNQPPVVSLAPEWTALEGTPITISATVADADGPAPLTYEWDLDGNGSFDQTTSTPAVSFTAPDNGTHIVKLRATDALGAASEIAQAAIIAGNAPPAFGALEGAPSGPIAAGANVVVSASFTDPALADTHTGSVEWDTGTGFTTLGVTTTADAPAQAGRVTASRTLDVGVYTLTLRVQDDDGGFDTRSVAPSYVVVYDPSAGFVTGGGWIASAAGDCRLTTACESANGKATFGFVSRYAQGATTPAGATEFQFHAADLRFRSSTYDWLVVAGARAKFKGEGTVNGAGRYRFLLTAIDGQQPGGGGADRFRIKIWTVNADGSDGSVVYDNQAGKSDDSDDSTVLGAGSIVVYSR